MRADRLISILLEAKDGTLVRRARRKFGLTGNPAEGGYILPSGRMLDFSEKRNGGFPGMRSEDHRAVGSLIDAKYDYGIDYIKHFIRSTGAVRMSYTPREHGNGESYLSVHFTHPPTNAQRRVIASMRPDRIAIDVDHPETGERVHSSDHNRSDMGSGLYTAYKVSEKHAIKP
jgi:hypothetical protein